MRKKTRGRFSYDKFQAQEEEVTVKGGGGGRSTSGVQHCNSLP
jgi:hypothetical protein